MAITFDREGYCIDGKSDFFISGEFHYFRVPHDDWRRRMRLFKDAGAHVLQRIYHGSYMSPMKGIYCLAIAPSATLRVFLRWRMKKD